MIETLSSFVFATFILSISPGPDNIFVLTQSLANGKKSGLAIVFGLMTGCLIHTSLVAFGLSAIIKQNETLFFSIKLLGALYLLYLAYQVFKSDVVLTIREDKRSKKTITQLFKTGFLMNVLNPKVTIFFLAFFPEFLFSEKLSITIQFYILGLLFIVVSMITFSMIALLSGSITNYLNKESRFQLYLKWLQIIVFVGISIVILFP